MEVVPLSPTRFPPYTRLAPSFTPASMYFNRLSKCALRIESEFKETTFIKRGKDRDYNASSIYYSKQSMP